jgi:ubiquinone/menaquinone biosynthesis C-methylase UbiE
MHNKPPNDWHARFEQQAGWTENLRRYILTRLDLPANARILECGCGTGAISSRLSDYAQYRVHGIDLHMPFLRLAARQDPATRYCGANALHLPYASEAFDAVTCHFFLLWVPQAGAALAEMVRVARPGAAVIAFAEPDYGGRIDHPIPLAELGALQAQSLRHQGADPNMGRKLSGLFHSAGLSRVETGLLGGQWQGAPSSAEIDAEWTTLEADLAAMLSQARLEELRRIDYHAWEAGERVLFVPTFYAIGYK